MKNKHKKKLKWALALTAFGAAAATTWVILRRQQQDDEKPPKGAPQLHLENPGTQDDFPKPPVDEGSAGIG